MSLLMRVQIHVRVPNPWKTINSTKAPQSQERRGGEQPIIRDLSDLLTSTVFITKSKTTISARTSLWLYTEIALVTPSCASHIFRPPANVIRITNRQRDRNNGSNWNRAFVGRIKSWEVDNRLAPKVDLEKDRK